MAVTVDSRTATTLILPDTAVTNRAGGAVIDLTGPAPGALQIAANLSDLADADTALANLGGTATGVAVFKAASAAAARSTLDLNVHTIVVGAMVIGSTAGVIYVDVPAHVSGTIDSIVATNSNDPGGDLTITPAIGPSGGPFVPITGGAIVVANTTAAGTKTSAAPSAANTVTGGTSVIEIAWDDGATIICNVTISIYVTRM